MFFIINVCTWPPGTPTRCIIAAPAKLIAMTYSGLPIAGDPLVLAGTPFRPVCTSVRRPGYTFPARRGARPSPIVDDDPETPWSFRQTRSPLPHKSLLTALLPSTSLIVCTICNERGTNVARYLYKCILCELRKEKEKIRPCDNDCLYRYCLNSQGKSRNTDRPNVLVIFRSNGNAKCARASDRELFRHKFHRQKICNISNVNRSIIYSHHRIIQLLNTNRH